MISVNPNAEDLTRFMDLTEEGKHVVIEGEETSAIPSAETALVVSEIFESRTRSRDSMSVDL